MTYEEITRWRGFSHAELYAQLHSGPGAAASAVPAQRWTEVEEIFGTINHDLTKVVADAQFDWQGGAATAAFGQLTEVAKRASRVSQNAASMRTSVERQADNIGTARATMPKPGENPSVQPDPKDAAVMQVLATQTDHEPVERATSEAARAAYEVMQTYQNDTTATTDGLREFDEPVATAGVQTTQPSSQREAINALPQNTVSVASAEFLGATTTDEMRARPSSGEPVANSGGSVAAALSPQRRSPVRRTPVPVDTHPIAPIAPAAATTGSGTERAAPRRSGHVQHAELAPKRRRDWAEEDKITERVDGTDAEVPPAVIGNGPYRP
ncbi:hypothetical protein LWC34_24640 [Kibdelosporangium philippinense]|uniref:PPE domain-containing protein n=1 Tax=Kibdelosporangium philippinense TaxID=211113 RepID=A0ABS8ZGF9_9PSEU|nr:hypothetical protein [Kibdelosporangium philippinense]MCE7005995.1 hypothetical protein [Kibdelosporangium philippinense]